MGSIPPWLQPAPIGPRLVAWMLDLAAFAFFSVIPLVVAAVSGSLGVNPEAARQLDHDPSALPNVPYLIVRSEPLAAVVLLWVALAVGYAAVCWALAGASLGQKTQSLVVVDARTGRPLSPPRAIWRALLVAGIPAALFAVSLFGVCQVMAVVPANLTSDAGRLSQPDVAGWTELFSWAGMLGVFWCGALLVSAGGARDRRGAHDRLSGSVVLRRRPLPGPTNQPVWWPATAVPPDLATPPEGGQTGADRAGAGPDSTPDAPSPPAYWTGLAGGVQSGRENEPDRPVESMPGPDATGAPEANPAAEIGRTGPLGSKLPQGLRIAAFRRRAGAYSLDMILLFLVYSSVQMMVAPTDASGELPSEKLRMLAGLLSGVAQAVYFVGCWWVLKGSIGQRLLGMQVLRESGDRRIGPMDALVRWALLEGPLALLMAAPDILAVGLLVVLFGWTWLLVRSVQLDPDGRGYQDRFAGSLVVEQAA